MPPRRLALVPLLGAAAGLLLSLLLAGPAAARTEAAAAERTYALDPLLDKLKVRPQKLSFRELEMTDLRWKRWGKDVARSRGISRILTCNPSCANGGAETTTTVKLSRIRMRRGKRVYTCMSWQDDEKVSDLPDHGSLNPFNFRPCRPPGATARVAKACRGIDLGFTTARVTARRLSCRRARFVILEWKRKTNDDGPPPRHLRALGFDCHFGGTDALLKLRCTKDDKLAKATWGG
jgi:hypothetical protein